EQRPQPQDDGPHEAEQACRLETVVVLASHAALPSVPRAPRAVRAGARRAPTRSAPTWGTPEATVPFPRPPRVAPAGGRPDPGDDDGAPPGWVGRRRGSCGGAERRVSRPGPRRARCGSSPRGARP